VISTASPDTISLAKLEETLTFLIAVMRTLTLCQALSQSPLVMVAN
jgi:hypothetical protein